MQHPRRLSSIALVAIVYGLAIFVVGFALHPIVAFWAENDDYVGKAESIMRGDWPRDALHPLGYPTIVGPVGWLLDNYFVGARLVSAVSAGVLLWLVFRLVRSSFSTACAWLATAWIAVHPYVIVSAMQTTSDLTAVALCAGTLLLATSVSAGAGARRVWLLGLSFGIAFWVRYPAAVLLAPIAIALLWPQVATGSRLGRIGRFATGAVVGLAPHFALSYAIFGRPVYSETWRNVAFRHFGDQDFNYVKTMPFDSWGSVLAHDPAGLAQSMLAGWGYVFGRDVPLYLTGNEVVTPVEWVAYSLVFVGLVWAIAARRPGVAFGVCFAILYLAAASATWGMIPRVALLGLPFLIGSAAVLILAVDRLFPNRERVRVYVRAALAVLVVGYVASNVPSHLAWFRSVHGDQELAAIQRIVAKSESPPKIVTSLWTLRHHAAFRPSTPPFPSVPIDAPTYLRELERTAISRDCGHAVVGSVSLKGREELIALKRALPSPLFATVEESDDVLVLELRRPELRIVESEPDHVEFEIKSPVPDDRTLRVFVTIATAPGEQEVIDFDPPVDGRATKSISIPATAGVLITTPYVTTEDGVLSGRPVRWTIR